MQQFPEIAYANTCDIPLFWVSGSALPQRMSYRNTPTPPGHEHAKCQNWNPSKTSRWWHRVPGNFKYADANKALAHPNQASAQHQFWKYLRPRRPPSGLAYPQMRGLHSSEVQLGKERSQHKNMMIWD